MFNRRERENEKSFPTRIDSFRLFLKDLVIVSYVNRAAWAEKEKRKKIRLQIRFNAINQASFFFYSLSLFQRYVWIYYGVRRKNLLVRC